MRCQVYLACARIKLNGSTWFFFLQIKLTEALISSGGKEVAAGFKIFVLSTHQNFLTPENLISQTLNNGNGLCFC